MKKIIIALIASAALAGCVGYGVTYQPGVSSSGYAIGYYNPGYGYWTGYGWDPDFYFYGHEGWHQRYDRDDRHEHREYHHHE